MAAIDPRIKQSFMLTVAQHLATVGATNWNVVLEKFPEVPVATQWRWIREAKTADVPRPELINAKAKLVQKVKKLPKDARRVESEEAGTENITRHLPAAPSPAYIARNGEAGLQTLDFVAEIHNLYRDANMLRAFSVSQVADDNGVITGEKIKNPAAFDKSIVRRADLLETAIKAVQEVWDLRTMQNFYETIIEEIGAESPAVQRRIMERLAVLNSKTGMTMSMRL
jgi:hypothetical protein